MIKKLSLEDFKAFGKEQQIPIKPLTLIYGANSSGKSSILQSLLLQGQSISDKKKYATELITEGDYVKLGTFNNLINNHNELNSSFVLSVTLAEPIELFREILNEEIHSTYKLHYKSSKDGSAHLAQIDFCLSCDNEYLIRYKCENDFNYFEISDINNSKIIEHDIHTLLSVVDASDCPSDQKEIILSALNNNFAQELRYIFSCSDYRLKFERFYGTKYADDLKFYGSSLKMYLSGKRVLQRQNLLSHIGEKAKINFAYSFPKESDVIKYDDTLDKALFRLTKNPSPLAKKLLEETKQEWQSYLSGTQLGKEVRSMEEIRKWEKSEHKILSLHINEIALQGLLKLFIFENKMEYIGPLRSFPKRYFIDDKALPSKEKSDIYGDSVAKTLHSNKGVLTAANEWFVKLHIPYSIDVSCTEAEGLNIYTIKLINKKNVEIRPSDVGFGISQILPVIVNALLHSEKLILIEQPEIHLHPRLQTELGDLLIYSAKCNNNTILAETHSEHLLLRIMKRMRQTANGEIKEISPDLALTPDDIAIVYVHSDGDGSDSIVYELELSEDGRLLDPWPGGFFEEGFRERF